MTSEERWAYEIGIEWSSDPRSLQELLPSAKAIMKGAKLIKMFETGWKVGKGKIAPLPDLAPAVVMSGLSHTPRAMTRDTDTQKEPLLDELKRQLIKERNTRLISAHANTPTTRELDLRRNIELLEVEKQRKGKRNPASPIGTQTRISVDFDVPAEKWWKSAMTQASRAPKCIKRLLTVRGPHTTLVSDDEANEVWEWASSLPGWQGSKASHPYPLKFESYARNPEGMSPDETWAYEVGIEWSSDSRSERDLTEAVKSVVGKKKNVLAAFAQGLRDGRAPKAAQEIPPPPPPPPPAPVVRAPAPSPAPSPAPPVPRTHYEGHGGSSPEPFIKPPEAIVKPQSSRVQLDELVKAHPSQVQSWSDADCRAYLGYHGRMMQERVPLDKLHEVAGGMKMAYPGEYTNFEPSTWLSDRARKDVDAKIYHGDAADIAHAKRKLSEALLIESYLNAPSDLGNMARSILQEEVQYDKLGAELLNVPLKARYAMQWDSHGRPIEGNLLALRDSLQDSIPARKERFREMISMQPEAIQALSAPASPTQVQPYVMGTNAIDATIEELESRIDPKRYYRQVRELLQRYPQFNTPYVVPLYHEVSAKVQGLEHKKYDEVREKHMKLDQASIWSKGAEARQAEKEKSELRDEMNEIKARIAASKLDDPLDVMYGIVHLFGPALVNVLPCEGSPGCPYTTGQRVIAAVSEYAKFPKRVDPNNLPELVERGRVMGIDEVTHKIAVLFDFNIPEGTEDSRTRATVTLVDPAFVVPDSSATAWTSIKPQSSRR